MQKLYLTRRLIYFQIRNFSLSNVNLSKNQNKFIFRESNQVGKVDRDQIPVALVFGWAGANDKHVAKYTDIYSNFGHHSIRIAPTVYFSIFQDTKHKSVSKSLLDSLIDDYKLTKNPIIVHTFSNAGIFLYRHLLEFGTNEQKYSFFKSNLKSMILDSGPGYLTDRKNFKRDVTALIQEEVKSKHFAQLIATLGLLAFKLYHETRPADRDYFIQSRDSILRNQKHIPLLFLMSKKDKLIDWKTTMEFVERMKLSIPPDLVEHVLFEDTEHVMHYMKHKDLYLDKLIKHLAKSNLQIYK